MRPEQLNSATNSMRDIARDNSMRGTAVCDSAVSGNTVCGTTVFSNGGCCANVACDGIVRDRIVCNSSVCASAAQGNAAPVFSARDSVPSKHNSRACDNVSSMPDNSPINTVPSMHVTNSPLPDPRPTGCTHYSPKVIDLPNSVPPTDCHPPSFPASKPPGSFRPATPSSEPAHNTVPGILFTRPAKKIRTARTRDTPGPELRDASHPGVWVT